MSPIRINLITPDSIFIGNLAYSAGDNDLADLCRGYGRIEGAKIVRDRSGSGAGSGSRSKGFGFVTFLDAAAAQACIDDLHGKARGGRTLTVRQATERGTGSLGDIGDGDPSSPASDAVMNAAIKTKKLSKNDQVSNAFRHRFFNVLAWFWEAKMDPKTIQNR